jgi:hypothetical protein
LEISKNLRCAAMAARFPRFAGNSTPFGCLVYRHQAPKLFLPAMPFIVLDEGDEERAFSVVRQIGILRKTRFAEIRLPSQKPLSKNWVQIHGDPGKEGLEIVEGWLQLQREVECVALRENDKHHFVIDAGVTELAQRQVLEFARRWKDSKEGDLITVTPDLRDRLAYFEKIAEMAGALVASLKD